MLCAVATVDEEHQVDLEVVASSLQTATRRVRDVLEQHGALVEASGPNRRLGIFGVPFVREDQARRAVHAALTLASVEKESDLGIGIATGTVLSTDPDDDVGSVVGTPVTNAVELAKAARPAEVLIDDTTRDLVEGYVVLTSATRGWEVVGLVESGQAGKPFTARSRELSAFRETLAQTISVGRPHRVVLAGEAGIGKSRLLAEAMSGLPTEPRTVAVSCANHGTWFTTAATSIGAALGETADERHERALELSNQLDRGDADFFVSQVQGVTGPDPQPPTTESLFWLTRRVFEMLARTDHLVWVLENIHLGDDALLDLVDHVWEITGECRLTIVTIGRTEVLERAPHWSAHSDRNVPILLEPLPASDFAELITGIVGGQLDHRDVARLHDFSRGNPLFAEEVVHRLRAIGGLEQRADGWVLSTDLRSELSSQTLHALLEERVDAVPIPERDVLDAASVVGEEVSQEDLIPLLTARPDRDMGRLLNRLVDRHLLIPVPGDAVGTDRYRFRHDLIREVTQASIPKRPLAVMHKQRAQDLLRKRSGPEVDVAAAVGLHLEAAGTALMVYREGEIELQTAAEHYRRAGAMSLAQSDAAGAARFLAKALDLVSGERSKLEIEYDLIEALIDLGELQEASALSERLLDELSGLKDPARRARAFLQRQLLEAFVTPTIDSSLASEVETLIPVLEQAGERLALAQAYELLAASHWTLAQYEASLDANQRALAYALTVGDRRAQARLVSASCGCVRAGPRPAEEAISYCVQARQERPDDLRVGAGSLVREGTLHALIGNFQGARELVGRGRDLLDDMGQKLSRAASTQDACLVEIWADRPREGAAIAREGLAALHAMEARGFIATSHALLAKCLFEMGDHRAALDEALRAQRLAEADEWLELEWGGTMAKALADGGALDRAVALMHNVVDRAERSDALLHRGDAYLDLSHVLEVGGLDGGREAALRALEAYERKGALVGIERARRKLS
ncbi:MAG TPA: AAA family ATPase [Actinomycetota bacterium]|nr:AAA family ATPase [Actinomycetota bacterium]